MTQRLFIPGPTPIPDEVQAAMVGPIVYHRGPEFPDLLTGVVEDAKQLFPTDNDLFLVSSSGTGAMEAAVVNTLSPGDRVVVAQAGNFGARWSNICNAYGIDVVEIEGEWGTSVDPRRVSEVAAESSVKAVLTTHSETSTGALHDVAAIGEAIRDQDVLLIVDGVSSICAHELNTSSFGVDVALTGSQKGLGLPPGLAAITFSERALKANETATCPRFYFDIAKYRASLAEGRGPATLPVTLISGLRAALDLILEEGIQNVWGRHARQDQSVREAIWAIGLTCFAKQPSNALTAVALPESVDGLELMDRLRQAYGAVVGGGLAHLRGRVIRISNLGFVADDDIRFIITALEESLSAVGYRFDRGTAIEATDRVLSQ